MLHSMHTLPLVDAGLTCTKDALHRTIFVSDMACLHASLLPPYVGDPTGLNPSNARQNTL